MVDDRVERLPKYTHSLFKLDQFGGEQQYVLHGRPGYGGDVAAHELFVRGGLGQRFACWRLAVGDLLADLDGGSTGPPFRGGPIPVD